MFIHFFFLQADTTRTIVTGIAAGMILFLLLNGFILAFVFLYLKKQRLHNDEMLKAKSEFEKQLLQSQLEIQEQTFNIVSQEIHDNVGQVLSLAKVQLNIMEEQDTMDKSKLAEVKLTVTHAIRDLRDIAKALNTERLRNFSMLESVEEVISRINRMGFVTITMTIVGEMRGFHDNNKLFLLRILQECFQNVLKHAAASQVVIIFTFGECDVNVSIRDNGIGFDTGVVAGQKAGLGLSNMRSRLGLVGGRLNIDSGVNTGTHIEISMPYG
jgi:two-component system, NarL family, sensor kinase